jgi:hypothetical protein
MSAGHTSVIHFGCRLLQEVPLCLVEAEAAKAAGRAAAVARAADKAAAVVRANGILRQNFSLDTNVERVLFEGDCWLD